MTELTAAIDPNLSYELPLLEPESALPGKDYFDIVSGEFVTTEGRSEINDQIKDVK